MNRLMIALVAALALPAVALCSPVAGPAKGTAMSESGNQVRQQLQVNAAGNKVVVTLALENAGSKTVYAPRSVYVDDEIFRREFEVVHQGSGAPVDYTGPMVKRGPLTREDFVAVKPGAKVSNSIDITRSYDFKPGTTYQLGYPGAYLPDAARLDAPAATQVAPVTFTFGGK